MSIPVERRKAARRHDDEWAARVERVRATFEKCMCGAARYRHADSEGPCYATGCEKWESERQVALLPDTLEEKRGER